MTELVSPFSGRNSAVVNFPFFGGCKIRRASAPSCGKRARISRVDCDSSRKWEPEGLNRIKKGKVEGVWGWPVWVSRRVVRERRPRVRSQSLGKASAVSAANDIKKRRKRELAKAIE